MTQMDPIADALVSIQNAEREAKLVCYWKPASKLLAEILRVMKEHGYIKAYDQVGDGRAGLFEIRLEGKINECRAIKPRYSLGKDEFEKFEKRFLPSKDVGLLIVTTPEGVLSHMDAKRKNIGGKLLAYVY